jgi:hypothetical protein
MEVEMDRVCGKYEEKNACRVLVWKPEGNTTFQTWTKREDNIKMDCNEKERSNVDWIHLVQVSDMF